MISFLIPLIVVKRYQAYCQRDHFLGDHKLNSFRLIEISEVAVVSSLLVDLTRKLCSEIQKTKLGKKDVNNSTWFDEIQHRQKKVMNKTASSNSSEKNVLIGFAEVTMNVTQFNME